MQKLIGFLVLSSIIVSCARMGTPGGGAKDITSPKFLGSKPDTLATKVDKNIKEIILNFDEYVIVKDISKQVIISPAPKATPSIEPASTARKYVSVKFYEPLQENTTYTINFGSGIQDNNEGNKLENFSYTFSTGDKIDSLQIAGQVKQSLERSKLSTAVVSLYKLEKDSKGQDSVNLKGKPYYISRVDTAGRFSLDHLHEGNFRLIAFNDLNSDLILNPEKEIAGFSTEIVNPKNAKQYDLVLSPLKQQYRAVGAEQDGQGVIKVKFKGNPKEVTITPLEKDFPPVRINHPNYADSLYIYFNNNDLKTENKRARLKFLTQYKEKTDTLSALYDTTTKTELALAAVEKEITPSNYFTLKSSNYITQTDNSKIEVYKNKDSKNKEPVAFETEIDSTNAKNVNIKFPIAFDSEYQIRINAKAFKDFLGNENSDTLTYTITTKKQSDYGNLNIRIQNKPAFKFFFQLLTEKYQVVESIYGENETFEFKNLKPGKYLVRILVDENNNGVWDPADLETFTPAEKTYIYPQPIDVRAFWNINEVWIL